MYKGKKIKY